MECPITSPPTTRAKIGQLLLQLSDDVLDSVNKALKTYRISESKLSLLLLLVRSSHQTQSLQPSEIAEKLGIRRASVTKQLDWLENHQLIIRTVGQKDLRMIHVSITNQGYELLNQVMPHYWQTCASFTTDLTEEESMVFLKLLQKIQH